jgi:hypothetical protein
MTRQDHTCWPGWYAKQRTLTPKLQHSGRARIAHQSIGGLCKWRIKPTRLGDAFMAVAAPATILNGGAKAGLQHFD